MVPRTVMIKHDQGRSEEEMRLKSDKEFPSTKEVFHSFVIGEKWQHYKLDVLDRLRTHKWLLNPSILDDVPLSIRQQCDRQCKFYGKRNHLLPVRQRRLHCEKCPLNRPIANMATISPKRGFSVATVAKGRSLVYMLM